MSPGPRRSFKAIEAKTLAATLARLAHDKKGEDVLVLDVAEQLGVADFFVLVTGLNRNHVRALVNELHVRTKAVGVRHQRLEGEGLYWWVVMDFGDVVVHVLQPEAREYYDMEHLFTGCPVLDWQAVETDQVEAAEA